MTESEGTLQQLLHRQLSISTQGSLSSLSQSLSSCLDQVLPEIVTVAESALLPSSQADTSCSRQQEAPRGLRRQKRSLSMYPLSSYMKELGVKRKPLKVR